MTPQFRLEGADGLYATFRELPRATKRNILMRILRQVIAPLADAVQSRAPYQTGELQEQQHTGPTTKLTRRQKRMERQDRGAFEAVLHFGTADPAGLMNEFGTINMAAQPYFRQEWEGRKVGMLREIGQELGPAIERSGERLRRKNARRG